ncbi:IclR family transcriptional regulator (plasmid) [Agrobacterium leguminum]|uniref:IclR family transcriptional regulator n=1 Tax=Agrobacterium leguminum TaxID=2792015 RepID=UPI00272BE522|nr:IclR family transcriptional regulator [Agrobacterium leguminum]WLE00695.1 IclR family transcriptional regulator [Agrobacterium leguminum]
MSAEEKRESGVKSLQLAFDVLEAVAAESSEIGVSELAAKLGTTKGTVFRHLQTLVERGYLAQNTSTQRYHIGVRSYLLGQAAAGRIDILSASQEAVRAMRDEIGETVVVSAIGNRGLTVLTTVLGKSPLEIGVRVGSALELHATAQGKVALAFSRSTLLPHLRRRGMEALTVHTIVDVDELERQLIDIRACGYAVSPNEDTLGINALAAPILKGGGEAVGAIAIVGSIQHIGKTPSQQQIDAVLRAALRVSWNLGYNGKIPFDGEQR